MVVADADFDGADTILACDGAIWQFTNESTLWFSSGDNLVYSSGNVNVGIGTTNPESSLHVVNTIGVNENVYFETYSPNPGGGALIGRKARGTPNSPAILQNGDTITGINGWGYDGSGFLVSGRLRFMVDGTPGTHIPTKITFETATETSGPAEKMVFTKDGYLGIGDPSPSVALDVVGDIHYTGIVTDVSDIRLKDNISPLNDPLEKLMRISAFSFSMKNDPKQLVEYGVSAQNVQTVFPDLVQVIDSENGYLGVNYQGLIAPMIEAIKEQQYQIETLRARIDVLESQAK